MNTQTKAAQTPYNVRRADGALIGTVHFAVWPKASGWRFFPQFQAQISRKLWPTPEAAIKGRAKGCTLEVMS